MSIAVSLAAFSLYLLLHPVAFTARDLGCRTLPSNIVVEAPLRPTVSNLLARSRTIRAQCVRIAAAPLTRVTIVVSVAEMGADARARSFARRYASGLLIVDVRIPPASGEFAELLGHELEHVLELIDGIDYRAAADSGRRTGVVRTGTHNTFESDRAQRAGRAAAAEVQDGRAPAPWRAALRFARARLRR